MFDNDLIALLPEIFLINATIILLIYGVIFSANTQKNTSSIADFQITRAPVLKRNTDLGSTQSQLPAAFVEQRPIIRNVAWLAILCIFITVFLCISAQSSTAILCYNTLIVDSFTFYFKIGLLISVACILLMSLQYFQQESFTAFESIILILLSTSSMLFMISAFDLITMYLAIELQSLCFYVLAASKRNSEFSTEAGLKYFILGAFSSGILLLDVLSFMDLQELLIWKNWLKFLLLH